ncbi:transposase-like protein [Paraburkholderia sp. BL6669N2]|nr:transposase-like protein [Paraburkholderia sp. BL6669N2]
MGPAYTMNSLVDITSHNARLPTREETLVIRRSTASKFEVYRIHRLAYEQWRRKDPALLKRIRMAVGASLALVVRSSAAAEGRLEQSGAGKYLYVLDVGTDEQLSQGHCHVAELVEDDRVMKNTRSLYYGHRFAATVINCAVRWYFRFLLSLSDIEKLLCERGVIASYETVRRCCDKFDKGFAHRLKAARRRTGTAWHLDEVFVTLRGTPYLLRRTVDQHRAELNILLPKRRDKAAAKRFFKCVLASCVQAPRKIGTDPLHSYPTAKAGISELALVMHVFVKASARVNNRTGNSHQPTRERERRMRGFRDPKRTQAFLYSFGPI